MSPGEGRISTCSSSRSPAVPHLVTGNAARAPAHPFFRRKFKEFRQLAATHGVALVDGTHYGTQKPPQLAMVDWFHRLGLSAEFHPDGPTLDE